MGFGCRHPYRFYEAKWANDLAKARRKEARSGIDCDPEAFEDVIDMLASETPLEARYSDHVLTGQYKGFRECHIAPDWLLIYAINRDELILTAARTGSHSDLF